MAFDVQIPLPDGSRMKGVMARPEGAAGAPRPGVVVIHELFGDQPEIRAVCDRFAADGYVAVMPDLFSIGGPRPFCVARALREVSSGRRGPVTGYIDATRDWLASQDDVDGERLGVIGFCMGGGFALLFAGAGPAGVKAAAANYAPVPKDIEALRNICPVVASYGGRDKSLPGHQKRLSRHLETLGVDNDVKVYDNAGHSFLTQGDHRLAQLMMVPMRLGYVESAAQDAWKRVFGFFDARLKETA